MKVLFMPKRRFYILDVFAEKKYSGNQLAVIRDSEGLTNEEMQKIAKEMNYSETTFILSEEEKEGGYDVRIFTPEVEVPFAGHPTLGTAYLIQQEIINEPVEEVVLNLKVGRIPVSFSHKGESVEEMFMHQKPPSFGVAIERETTAEVLGIDVNEIDDRFPVMEVSTGIPFIIAPLKTMEGVKKCKLDEALFSELIKSTEIRAFMIFCPETEEEPNDIHARVFAHYYGVPEDPATGSANGCLAGYLVKHKYFGKSKIDIRVEQGYEIGRPSRLYLKAEEKDGKIDVFVGGKAILIGQGELL
jgi:trans-2,3-dihydro-3-hydroxyanthranilate isomerase